VETCRREPATDREGRGRAARRMGGGGKDENLSLKRGDKMMEGGGV